MRGERADAGWHWLMSVKMIALETLAHACASVPAQGASGLAPKTWFVMILLAAVCGSSARREHKFAATRGVTVKCSRNLRRFTNAPPQEACRAESSLVHIIYSKLNNIQ
jgi:hypothetical protein